MHPKKWFFIASIVGFNLFNLSAQIDYKNYNLVFSEDFKEANINQILDDGNWKFGMPWGDGTTNSCHQKRRTGCGTGIGCRNNILDTYAKNNLSIKNGMLNLVVSKTDSWQNKPQNSADCYYLYEGTAIHSTVREPLQQDIDLANYRKSKGKVSQPEDFKGWLYGLFEIDCIIPDNPNYYSAFWLWASRGGHPEIDIFEVDHGIDKKYDYFSNVHSITKDNVKTQARETFKTQNLFNEMHTWSVLWTPDFITMYLDGKEYRTYTDLPKDNSSWRKVDLILSIKPTFQGKKSAYLKRQQKNFIANEPFLIDEVRVFKPKKNYSN